MSTPPDGKQFSAGGIRGILYRFAPGDVLEMHAHTAFDNHITIVLKGSVRIHGPGRNMVAGTGYIVDFAIGEEHEIAADEPATILNLLKGA